MWSSSASSSLWSAASGVEPRWVWHFVLFMTAYNALKYPLIARATPARPYRISSVLGGTVEATSPRWFLLLHVPVMVVSNVAAALLGLGVFSSEPDRAAAAHVACVALETFNLVILLPPRVHQHLGSGKGLQPTILNLGTAIPMVVFMWLSVAGAPAWRLSYFAFGYAFKCIGIFAAEMLALAVTRGSKPADSAKAQ